MAIPWDGTGIDCYGMGQINMSHGQPCKYGCSFQGNFCCNHFQNNLSYFAEIFVRVMQFDNFTNSLVLLFPIAAHKFCDKSFE